MEYQGYPQSATTQGVGVGPRFLAILIDGIVIGIIGFIINLILGANQYSLTGSLDGLIYFIYYIVLEATNGATLGKMALGLRVVKLDGTPISWSESVIRNLLRIIDALFFYLVGAILVWTSSRNQRLGDMAAHTLVVKKR